MSTMNQPFASTSRPWMSVMIVGNTRSSNRIDAPRLDPGHVSLAGETEMETRAVLRLQEPQQEQRHVDVPLDDAHVVAGALS